MTKKLELFKKKLLYRASYRGTKEMDILLSSFVKKHVNLFTESQLIDLEKFLDFEDEIILNYYNFDKILLEELSIFLDFDDEIIFNFYNKGLVEKKIDKNKISKIFKNFKI